MEKLFSLKNKVVIVTGGSGYLGSAMVQGLITHGASVVVADIHKIPENLKKFQDLGKLKYIKCDMSNTKSIKNMFKESSDLYGKIDVVINNVAYGAGYGEINLEDMSDETWEIGLDGSLGTAFRCTRESIPYLENTKGCIVNISSMYGMVSPEPAIYGESGANNPVNYGAGKSGILQLTRYCAGHLAQKNIRVNSISPGPFPNSSIETDKSFLTNLANKTMLKRTGKQHEIVGPIILLSSKAGSYITGANIVVDGGWTAW